MSIKTISWNSESFHSAESHSSRNSRDSGSKQTSLKSEPANENMDPLIRETSEFANEQLDNTPLPSSPLTKMTKNSFPPKRIISQRPEALQVTSKNRYVPPFDPLEEKKKRDSSIFQPAEEIDCLDDENFIYSSQIEET